MGQCGCGDINLIAARPVPGTDGVLAVDEYRGCRECETPIGLMLFFFNPEGQERWVEGWSGMRLGAPLEPSENGEDGGYGWVFPFIGQSELVKAAREHEGLKDVHPSNYETLAELLSDWGLTLLQEAMARRPKRSE